MEALISPTDMINGTFRLKGRQLYEQYGKQNDKSIYRVHKDGGVNYTTIFRWINDAENIDSVKSDILFGYLAGLGLSVDEILTMSLGDLFEFTPPDDEAAK